MLFSCPKRTQWWAIFGHITIWAVLDNLLYLHFYMDTNIFFFNNQWGVFFSSSNYLSHLRFLPGYSYLVIFFCAIFLRVGLLSPSAHLAKDWPICGCVGPPVCKLSFNWCHPSCFTHLPLLPLPTVSSTVPLQSRGPVLGSHPDHTANCHLLCAESPPLQRYHHHHHHPTVPSLLNPKATRAQQPLPHL